MHYKDKEIECLIETFRNLAAQPFSRRVKSPILFSREESISKKTIDMLPEPTFIEDIQLFCDKFLVLTRTGGVWLIGGNAARGITQMTQLKIVGLLSKIIQISVSHLMRLGRMSSSSLMVLTECGQVARVNLDPQNVVIKVVPIKGILERVSMLNSSGYADFLITESGKIYFNLNSDDLDTVFTPYRLQKTGEAIEYRICAAMAKGETIIAISQPNSTDMTPQKLLHFSLNNLTESRTISHFKIEPFPFASEEEIRNIVLMKATPGYGLLHTSDGLWECGSPPILSVPPAGGSYMKIESSRLRALGITGDVLQIAGEVEQGVFHMETGILVLMTTTGQLWAHLHSYPLPIPVAMSYVLLEGFGEPSFIVDRLWVFSTYIIARSCDGRLAFTDLMPLLQAREIHWHVFRLDL